MSQYWIPINIDKKEFIHPHKLGSGMRLWEQIANHPGTGSGLILLLAAGGDLEWDDDQQVIGRWAGDRIALVGEYAEIYTECESGGGGYLDISDLVAQVIERGLSGKFEGEGWKDFVRGED